MALIIEAHELTRRFGSKVAVENVTLLVESGEVLGLLGPNGAGKTTTIRMLAGMIAPTSGYATVAGIRTDRESARLHEVVGLLTESPGFYERLSARRNLEYFAGFYPNPGVIANIEKYLRVVRLWERREDKVGTFSRGMKQRLSLARALLHEPQVLFLDEPTAGLDPEVASEVRELIQRLGREGRTVFLCTHNLAEAEALCGRIAIIQGRLVTIATPGQLRRRFFQQQVIVKLQAADVAVRDAVSRLPFVKDARLEGAELVVDMTEPDRHRPELVRKVVEAGGQVLGVSEKQHSLEEVYLRLVREERSHGS